MSDAFGFEIQRAPDGFWSSVFTRMSGEMKAMLRPASVDRGEPFSRSSAFIAADAEGDHIAIVKLDRQIEHTLRFLRAELPNGIEDPQQRNAEVFLAALAAAFEAFEDRGKILFAPQTDADRNDDFSVQNILRFQAFHQSVRNQFVVFGSSQMSSNVFESGKETGEVFVVVE